MTFKQLFATDKLLHAAACFVLTTIGTALFAAQEARLAWGVAFAVAFAIGKEIYDFATFNKKYAAANGVKPAAEYQAARRQRIVDCIFDLGYDIIGTVIACFCLTAIGA